MEFRSVQRQPLVNLLAQKLKVYPIYAETQLGPDYCCTLTWQSFTLQCLAPTYKAARLGVDETMLSFLVNNEAGVIAWRDNMFTATFYKGGVLKVLNTSVTLKVYASFTSYEQQPPAPVQVDDQVDTTPLKFSTDYALVNIQPKC